MFFFIMALQYKNCIVFFFIMAVRYNRRYFSHTFLRVGTHTSWSNHSHCVGAGCVDKTINICHNLTTAVGN